MNPHDRGGVLQRAHRSYQQRTYRLWPHSKCIRVTMNASAGESTTMSFPGLRLLAEDNNVRGDLFGRLAADLFLALGYDQPRINISHWCPVRSRIESVDYRHRTDCSWGPDA